MRSFSYPRSIPPAKSSPHAHSMKIIGVNSGREERKRETRLSIVAGEISEKEKERGPTERENWGRGKACSRCHPRFYDRSPKGSIPDVVYIGIAHRGGTLCQINSRFARTDRAEIYAKLGDPLLVSFRLAIPVVRLAERPPSDSRPLTDRLVFSPALSLTRVSPNWTLMDICYKLR